MNFHVGNSESSGFGLFSRAVNHAMLRYAGCAGIVVVFAGVFGGSGARAAPFANGSFELPGLSAGSSTELLPGNTALPGWTVSGSGGPISYGYSGTSAKHGSHDLTFNSGNRSPGMRISQTFDTVPGTNYLVTFHIRRSGAGGGTASLTASAFSANATLLRRMTAIAGTESWGPLQQLPFTATTSTTTLELLDSSTATIGLDLMLDSVNVATTLFANVRYQITDLGTLGGDTRPFGINASGHVVGSSGPHAFLWKPDTGIVKIADNAVARAINDSNQIAGDDSRGFLWQQGQPLNYVTPMGALTQAINNSGKVAGQMLVADAPGYAAFSYQNGTLTRLSPNDGYASSVNAAGNVAGWTNSGGRRGVIWNSSGSIIRDLGAGEHHVVVNDSDQVAFGATFSPQAGVNVDLGSLGGGGTIARAINNTSMIVGYSNDPGGRRQAVLWRDFNGNRQTDPADLADLTLLMLDSESNLLLEEAHGVNDSGQIVGTGRRGGQQRAFLLTPVNAEEGLLARWRFDEGSGTTAADSSGYGRHGVIQGASWITGKFGGALRFANHSVIVNPFRWYDGVQNTELTVAFWTRIADAVNQETFVSYAVDGQDNALFIGYGQTPAVSPRTFHIQIDGVEAPTTVTAADSLWHHIALTWRRSDGKWILYKDGLQAATGEMKAGFNLPSAGSLVFGQEQDSVGGGFESSQALRGDLDDVRIYSRVLSPTEILRFSPLVGGNVTFAYAPNSYRKVVLIRAASRGDIPALTPGQSLALADVADFFGPAAADGSFTVATAPITFKAIAFVDFNDNGRLDFGEPRSPAVDATGEIENVSSLSLAIPAPADTDGDGMDDGWELANGTNPVVADGSSDLDGDEVSNLFEYRFGTKPLVADSDGDGLSDFLETFVHGTDPLKIDTDGDGLPDKWEIDHGLNPLVNDASDDRDRDGLTNLEEFQSPLGLNPSKWDTNGNGQSDFREVNSRGLNRFTYDRNDRLIGVDYDNGLTLGYRYDANSNIVGQKWLVRPNTVTSRLPEAWAYSQAFSTQHDPSWSGDPDGDGWSNYQEFLSGSNPLDSASTPLGSTGVVAATVNLPFAPTAWVMAAGRVSAGAEAAVLAGADGAPAGSDNKLLIFCRGTNGTWSKEEVSVGAFGITSIVVQDATSLSGAVLWLGLRAPVGGQGRILKLVPGAQWTTTEVVRSQDTFATVVGVLASGDLLGQFTPQAAQPSVSNQALYHIPRATGGTPVVVLGETGSERLGACETIGRTVYVARWLTDGRLQVGSINALSGIAPPANAKMRPGSASAYLMSSASTTWFEAETWATNLGAHLATITSQAEQDWIRNNMGITSAFWIGLLRTGTATTDWRWVNNEPFSYSAWVPGEPNNSNGNEDRATLRGDALWNDQPASNNTPLALAEWDSGAYTSAFINGPFGAKRAVSFVVRNDVEEPPKVLVVSESATGSLETRIWGSIAPATALSTESRALSSPAEGSLALARVRASSVTTMVGGVPDGGIWRWDQTVGQVAPRVSLVSGRFVGVNWLATTSAQLGAEQLAFGLSPGPASGSHQLVAFPIEAKGWVFPTNGEPRVALVSQQATGSGDVRVAVRIWDAEGNRTGLELEYFDPATQTWKKATIVDALNRPLTAATSLRAEPGGTTHDVYWLASQDLGGVFNGSRQLRVRTASTAGAGTPSVALPYTLAVTNVGNPDFRIDSAGYPGGARKAGDTFTVTVTGQNIGAASAGATVAVRLSRDQIWGNDDDRSLGSTSFVPDAGTGSISTGLNAVVPSSVTIGDYYVMARFDATDAVDELRESNNLWVSATANVTITELVAPVIATHPASRTVNVGASVAFAVVATGSPPLSYQWRKGGVALAGETGEFLVLSSVQTSAAGIYSVVVSNGVGTATSNDATLTVNFPPTITGQPVGVSAAAGASVSFTVSATGAPTLTYRWRKNGVAIDGATNASLAMTAVLSSDAGNYSVMVSNGFGSALSDEARLNVVPLGVTASHAMVGAAGYSPGSTLTIANTLTYPGSAASLGWQVLLPANWILVSSAGAQGELKPGAGTASLLEWAWINPPPSPVAFNYTLQVPTGESGTKSLAARATLRLGDPSIDLMALPDPLLIVSTQRHSADTMGSSPGTPPDGRLNLAELLRVIELYNYRSSTVRTGQYSMQTGTEDGFALGPAGAAVTVYHSADTMGATVGTLPDGRISLAELLRVIELYNYRAGTVRTGQYRVQAGTEDGFAPGP